MTDEIRPARSDDIEGLVALLAELFSIEQDFVFDADKQRQGLELLLAVRDGAEVFVAEHQGAVVAMCSVQRLVSTAEGGYAGLVEDLVVSPGHRGRGVGKKLLSAIETWALRQGWSRLQLLADKDNQPALDFYHRRDWSATRLVALRKLLNT